MIDLGMVCGAYRQNSQEGSLASILQTDHRNVHLRRPVNRGFLVSSPPSLQLQGYALPLSSFEDAIEQIDGALTQQQVLTRTASAASHRLV
jgi:hypothetical protein